MVYFQVFPDFAHQAELEKYQGRIKLDNENRFHGAQGKFNHDIKDKNWMNTLQQTHLLIVEQTRNTKDIKK